LATAKESTPECQPSWAGPPGSTIERWRANVDAFLSAGFRLVKLADVRRILPRRA
jgi:hypothetical protein